MPNDPIALTLEGSTKWPDKKVLLRLAQTRADLGLKKVEEIFTETADAISLVANELRKYFSSEREVGTRILSAWETNIKESLGLTKGLVAPHATPATAKPASIGKPQRQLARSDGLLLEFLRQNAGTVKGTLASIATKLDIPPYTLSASAKLGGKEIHSPWRAAFGSSAKGRFDIISENNVNLSTLSFAFLVVDNGRYAPDDAKDQSRFECAEQRSFREAILSDQRCDQAQELHRLRSCECGRIAAHRLSFARTGHDAQSKPRSTHPLS